MIRKIANPAIAIVQNVNDNRKHNRSQRRYNKMIAESQAKIGPYQPASIPVQVWA